MKRLTTAVLRHPSLTYRLTGKMVAAAHIGRACLYSEAGHPLLVIRPSAILPDYTFTNAETGVCVNHITDRIPGQLARTRFALQLAAAESSARIHTDY